jgi:beta-glucosidase-like glycosyl hydrolase
MFNIGAAAGLDCWGPVLNLNRDVRWGRNGESGPECPFLMSMFSSSFTLGFQRGLTNAEQLPRHAFADVPPVQTKENPFLNGVVTIKHWDGNSLEDSDGFTRHNFNDNVSDFVLSDSYFPAFRAGIRVGALGVMCAYNAVQGVPSCTSPLLKAQLEAWNYSGYVTSDSDAVADAWKPFNSKSKNGGGHGAFKTAAGASCAAITKGWCDINSGDTFKKSLAEGVASGHCTWADVDRALARTLSVRFKLGLFGDRATQPLTKLGLEEVGSDAGTELAVDAAAQSMTLLERGVLPFTPSSEMKLAVFGPLANATTAIMGTHYKGAACPGVNGRSGGSEDDTSCVKTLLQELTTKAATASVSYGGGCAPVSCTGIPSKCALQPCTQKAIAAAVAVAKESTHVVVALGISGLEKEGEDGDRASIDLPDDQRALTTALLALGKPTVFVMFNGGAVSLMQEKRAGAAILEAFLPGKHGAGAVADVILGNKSPAGRLPYTVYDKDFVTQTSMTEMDPTAGVGKTYRYFTGVPLWPFGRGLTFTSFALSKGKGWPAASALALEAASTAKQTLHFPIEVHNTGRMDSDVVITAYWSGAGSITPIRKQLFEYERIHVKAGESVSMVFSVSALNFVLAAQNGDLVSAPSNFTLNFDDGSDSAALSSVLEITGSDQVLVEKFPSAAAGTV